MGRLGAHRIGWGGVGPECEQVSALRPIRECLYICACFVVSGKTGEQRERGRGDRHQRSPGNASCDRLERSYDLRPRNCVLLDWAIEIKGLSVGKSKPGVQALCEPATVVFYFFQRGCIQSLDRHGCYGGCYRPPPSNPYMALKTTWQRSCRQLCCFCRKLGSDG